MRVTIVPSDKFIRKDDDSVNLPEWNFDDSNIHAIQWYDTWGEVEYTGNPKPLNDLIQEDSILQPYLTVLNEYLTNLSNNVDNNQSTNVIIEGQSNI